MARKSALVGEVIALTGAQTGRFVVRVTRYPSGRLLPAPRILLPSAATCFASRLAALEALGQWSHGELRALRHLKASDHLTAPAAPRPAKSATPLTDLLHNHAQDYELEHAHVTARKRRAAKAKRVAKAKVLPAVEKMPEPSRPFGVRTPRDKVNLAVDQLIALGAVTVTRCPSGKRQADSRW